MLDKASEAVEAVMVVCLIWQGIIADDCRAHWTSRPSFIRYYYRSMKDCRLETGATWRWHRDRSRKNLMGSFEPVIVGGTADCFWLPSKKGVTI